MRIRRLRELWLPLTLVYGFGGWAGSCVPACTARAQASLVRPAGEISGTKLVVRARGWTAEFSLTAGLNLAKLRHVSQPIDLISAPTPIFAVVAGEEVVSSQAFAVTAAEADEAGARVALAHHRLGLAAEMTLRPTDGAEILLRLRVTNRGEKPSTIRVIFPLLMGLRPGSDPAEWHYFYPFKGGWAGNHPFDLAGAYGLSSGSLQHMSVFNPLFPLAVWASVRDGTGTM
ncbi:MAG: hypothetical protein N2512_03225, partial [Armatimonadetes bacterium]|nr:hypothetical protein [Armatimonadota bacterium]